MNRNRAGERNSSSPSSPRGSHWRDEVIAITSLALIQDADKWALLICAGPIEGTAAPAPAPCPGTAALAGAPAALIQLSLSF